MDDQKPRPDDKTPRPSGAESARLREDIDSGATGDKVPFSDPSAAPLGTDAEAGGAPAAAPELRANRAEEAGHDASSGQPEKRTPSDLQGRAAGKRNMTTAAVVAVVGLVIVVIAVMVL
ncbi:hypothetical protein GCM10011534_19080 [Pseudooceanicola nanhaiensis]|jgi:hypothetical protein|uniref:Uncharacterized protein n=1 Tax=Pseudooceanicola nanhaiensis TaxID=375761 RepID=A0A917STV1_9RHOB|nr:hypothetical protein [Pseudooceanicola nanhaiensis]GGL97264.1 hypothetical protein GCM10011534_19080 [Pseudooceanicola nanhaiensis]